ncbi:hypothetical protein GRO01_23020 [Gluconobacter roseus NBRC 3990]|uniref:Uncharacterized protein n=1 Tax=Gluconobacter roseus NBRC 3990 TaxID=1307950 RepID=A0A4Y3M9Z3_9PROT|nr:hypothetical protein AA3990_1617 [Gluconobacter roseus NBRC 3990]GEB04726.1 hypothetical protein GRO01_23020 [Gluconobacter roseus NBRC 3990]GLP92139.1 hypothetical protein GCM10007871_01170 [Gluconobacter roseus NBRC 3990]
MGQSGRNDADPGILKMAQHIFGWLRSRKVQIVDGDIRKKITNRTADKPGSRQNIPDPLQTGPVREALQQACILHHAGRESGKKQS